MLVKEHNKQIQGGSIMGRKVACFVLVALFAFSTFSAADVIKLKFANYFPPTHMNSVMMGKYCEELNKKLAGKVELPSTLAVPFFRLIRWRRASLLALPISACQISPIREGVFLLWRSWNYPLVSRAAG